MADLKVRPSMPLTTPFCTNVTHDKIDCITAQVPYYDYCFNCRKFAEAYAQQKVDEFYKKQEGK